MGIKRSRKSADENEESQLHESQPYDGTNFSKPLPKKLFLPWIDTPIDEEDEYLGLEVENSTSGDTDANHPQSESEGATEYSPDQKHLDSEANEAEDQAKKRGKGNFNCSNFISTTGKGPFVAQSKAKGSVSHCHDGADSANMRSLSKSIAKGKVPLVAHSKAKGSVSPSCYEADSMTEKILANSILAKGKEPSESGNTQTDLRISEGTVKKSSFSKSMVSRASGGNRPPKRVSFQELDSELARDNHKSEKAQGLSSSEIPRAHDGSEAMKTLEEQDLVEQLAEVEIQAAHLYMERLDLIRDCLDGVKKHYKLD